MTGKTNSLNLTNSFQTILENESESGSVVEVITLVVSNITSEASVVDVVITRNSEDFFILKSGGVPANKSLSVFLSKDFGVYLEPGDSLRLKADDDLKADAVCSYYIKNLETSSSSSSEESSSSSCSECEDCVQVCQQEPSWDLDDCVAVNVDLSKLFYIDDGNLPESCPPTGPGVVYIPKQLTMKITSGCLAPIETRFEYLPNPNVWGRIWNGTGAEEVQPEYNLNPDTDCLIVSTSGTSSLNSLRINYYELQPNDNWDSTLLGLGTIEGNLPIHVRYRREYGDYVFVKAEGTSFTRKNCIGCVCDEVPAKCPRFCEVMSPNSNLVNSWSNAQPNETQLWGCNDANEVLNSLTVEVTGENTCRPPLPCVVGQCFNIVDLNELDETPGPCDKCYCDGGGRPLDIDVHCNGTTIRPKSEDFPGTESFTLWFNPRGTSAVPVINNVIYDTTQLDAQNDIVKIHQASTPEELRSWVCLNLRFATVLDYEKLKTDTENAIDSNWPYNDLYWNRSFVVGPSCSGYPFENDVPVNLVPC